MVGGGGGQLGMTSYLEYRGIIAPGGHPSYNRLCPVTSSVPLPYMPHYIKRPVIPNVLPIDGRKPHLESFTYLKAMEDMLSVLDMLSSNMRIVFTLFSRSHFGNIIDYYSITNGEQSTEDPATQQNKTVVSNPLAT
uniref:Uncharacterized protein n=1 Tax=Romanomermis culicivorax TaxID=13658 RepID=A0A915IFC4_ROMCU